MNIKRKGFTLIELLVVVAIIAILTVLIIVTWTSAQKKARDSKRKSDLQSIASATEMFYSENKKYPAGENTNTAYSIKDIKNETCNVNSVDAGELQARREWVCLVANKYLGSWPSDPAENQGYYYYVIGSPDPNRAGYKIITDSTADRDTFESSGTSDCESVAGEYFDTTAGEGCKRLQVSNNSASAAWSPSSYK